MLKRLELTGFKSFAKKTSLDFSAPISAVVGPNGSGKSNVAEALRWALGEQSLKSLRGKRGEDLIFNGSHEAARLNQATVSVVFDNREKKFNLDFDEVVLTRRVYRDGVNEYLVNGSQVRLKDIIEILAAVGIGASSHHIISQGEADRILSESPQERRGMISDALGLKIYEFRRDESEKKLAKTEENLRQVEALRREVKPHLVFLKKQVDKWEAVETMRAELREIYLVYFKVQEKFLEEQRRKLMEERREPEEALRALSDASPTNEVRKHGELSAIEQMLVQVRVEKDECVRKAGRLEGIVEAKSERRVLIPGTRCGACGQVIASVGQVTPIANEEEERMQIEIQRASIAERLVELKREEDKLLTQADAVRSAERAVYEARARESELRARLDGLAARGETLRMDAEDFKNSLSEAAPLVGTVVMEYNSRAPEDTTPAVDIPGMQMERRRKIERLKVRIEDAGGESAEVVHEYRQASERDAFLARESEDLTKSADSLREVIADLGTRLDTEFKNGVGKINAQFGNFFSLMFGGGTAELASDVDGVEVVVSLPRKKIRGLAMLSGGERALTSIALLFAISQVNPPPFLVLDETDAALDEANSRKYGDMIEALSKYSQLILVTHNRETMARASILYGVTMGSDAVSRLLSVKLDEAIKVAK